jgi:HD-like signal output (HDOD) protein
MVAPSLMNSEVDKRLDSIVLKAVQKEPQARFPDAASMKDEISRYLELKRGGKRIPSEKKETHSTVDFLLRRMQHKSDFPAFSASILEINNMTSSESNTSASELANTILKDYALTNKLLKLANSAFYRQVKGGISDINKAVVILGFEQVRLAASSLMLFSHFGNETSATELRDAIIKSFMGGIIARDLAIKEGVKKTEVGFICSMFHNLGKNLTIYYFPEEYEEIKNRMTRENLDIQSSAVAVLGISLDELGVSVAREWKFPESIIYSMRSLPHGSLEPPSSILDKLRHYSVFANELCEIADSFSTEQNRDSFDNLINRFNPSFSISYSEVSALLNSATEKILKYASILDIDPNKSPFIQNLLKFYDYKEVRDDNIQPDETPQVIDSVDIEESGHLPLPMRIWLRMTGFLKK